MAARVVHDFGLSHGDDWDDPRGITRKVLAVLSVKIDHSKAIPVLETKRIVLLGNHTLSGDDFGLQPLDGGDAQFCSFFIRGIKELPQPMNRQSEVVVSTIH